MSEAHRITVRRTILTMRVLHARHCSTSTADVTTKPLDTSSILTAERVIDVGRRF